uniref:N-acylneuraminate-9-phosphatase n=1 Tax=Strigamia maritima TaxID=126957 RepID=T1IIG0_STRMM
MPYFQIQRYLCDHGVAESCASETVEEYLKCFRANPQNPNPNRPDLDPWRRLLWAYALGPEWDYLLEKVYPIWKKTRFENLLFSDKIKTMLKTLHKKYKLVLITNGPSKAQWEKIQKLNARDYFDLVLVSGDHKVEKPDPAIFQMAFEALNITAEECIMVGDTLSTDIQGGFNAGVAATVWIPIQESDRPKPKPKPDYKISKVLHLPALLSSTSTAAAAHLTSIVAVKPEVLARKTSIDGRRFSNTNSS